MPFHFIYRDFLKFLDALDTQEAWEAYQRYYLHPHREFLMSYWHTFRWMDHEQIRDRVCKIKRGDYSNLENLLVQADLKDLAEKILLKCMDVIEVLQEPEVYFIVGFFSADGFVLEFGGKPVVGFGLERFKSWRLLPVLFAHEYAHYVRHLWRKDEPYFCDGPNLTRRFLLSEGLATAFSEIVFPENPLNEHLFLSEERLSWCQENWDYLAGLLEQMLKGERDPALFWRGDIDLGVPSRVGNYIGYTLVKEFFMNQTQPEFRALLSLGSIEELFGRVL